jgi:hypothetical protein
MLYPIFRVEGGLGIPFEKWRIIPGRLVFNPEDGDVVFL